MAHYPWEKSYPPGVKWELEVPKKTIHQIFEESCAQYADRPFTDFLDKEMTFGDYKKASDHAAAGFQKLGVGPGVNVGLYLPNTPHYLIAFFGILLDSALFPASPGDLLVLQPLQHQIMQRPRNLPRDGRHKSLRVDAEFGKPAGAL
jgi:non-ribosomal peptide synthetase component F